MKPRPKLLVVDDEPNIRRILQVAFEKAGYEVFPADDAYSALEALAEQPFECVLTDVTMPGMTGYELLRAVKERRPESAVVIMTPSARSPSDSSHPRWRFRIRHQTVRPRNP